MDAWIRDRGGWGSWAGPPVGVVLVGAVGLSLAGCNGNGGNASAGDPLIQCGASSGHVATSGGDHGPLWEPASGDGVDETGAPLLDVGTANDEDPTEWELDEDNAIFYRSPTELEMKQHGWTADHLLVVFAGSGFVEDVIGGQNAARLALPIHDGTQGRPQIGLEVAGIHLARQFSDSSVPYLEAAVQPSGVFLHQVLWPTMSMYLPAGIGWDSIPERIAAVMASSRGGLSIHGGADFERFWVRGPYEDGEIYELEIEPPEGNEFFIQRTVHGPAFSAMALGEDMMGRLAEPIASTAAVGSLTDGPRHTAAQTRFGQCNDNLDNDPDEDADDCDYNCVVHKDYGGDTHDYELHWEYSKDYTVVGDLKFCIKHPTPETEIDLIAQEASVILNNVQPPPPYDPPVRTPPFRMPVRGCFEWPGANDDDVDACHQDAGNCPVGYPFGGGPLSAASLYNRSWEGYEALILNADPSGIRPVHIAAVLTGQLIGVNGASPGFIENGVSANGRVVVWDEGNNTGGAGGTLAHEIGHTLGLAHDFAFVDGTPGFMQDQTSIAPVLAWGAPSDYPGLTQGEVWRDMVPDKLHPRANGFDHTGCVAADCTYPGLSCINDHCSD